MKNHLFFITLLSLLFISICISTTYAIEEEKPSWWNRIKDWVTPNNNKIRFTPSELNTESKFAVAIPNGIDDMTLDKTYSLHLLFPDWWINNIKQQPNEPNCAISINDESTHLPLRAQYTPVTWKDDRIDTPTQIKFTIESAATLRFNKNDRLRLICENILTPTRMPTANELKQFDTNAINTNAFGFVLRRNNADDVLDRDLTLDTTLTRNKELNPFNGRLVENKDFANTNNHIHLNSPHYDSWSRLTTTVENPSQNEIIITRSDHIDIILPTWWRSASDIGCSIALNDDKESIDVDSHYYPQTDTQLHPILRLRPKLHTLIDFTPSSTLRILCDGVLIPKTIPTEDERKQQDLIWDKADLNIYRNNNNNELIYQQQLTIDNLTKLKRLPSSAKYLMSINVPTSLNHHRGGPLVGDDINRKTDDKFHHAICAYIQKLGKVNDCEIKTESISPTSSTLVYEIHDDNIHDTPQLVHNMSQLDDPNIPPSQSSRITAFKLFIRDLFKLNVLPDIKIAPVH